MMIGIFVIVFVSYVILIVSFYRLGDIMEKLKDIEKRIMK